ncbi:MAG: TIGR03620 family F420-dependent LLM class oxidoreductase [Actinomycetota bacterium]
MGAEADTVRRALGRVGVWTFGFDGRGAAAVAVDVRTIETLGYPALWIPEGSGSPDILAQLSWLLASSRHLTVASGIANVTARAPDVLARGASLLADAYPKRLALGVGIGHEYSTERRGIAWDRPLMRMRSYLDAMDAAADALPSAPRLLAALGDGMLRLSSAHALGAHTYFVPVAHTAHARRVLGPKPVLAVEQGVMLTSDDAEARALARAWARHYLELPNYANNWRRLGFDDEDVAGSGSDRLLDAGFAWGADAIVARVREHVQAGADHVCVQVIGSLDAEADLLALRTLAPALLSV